MLLGARLSSIEIEYQGGHKIRTGSQRVPPAGICLSLRKEPGSVTCPSNIPDLIQLSQVYCLHHHHSPTP